jgi:hypothetical protein
MFVGSVVAGVPLLAVTGVRSFAQAGSAAPHAHSAAGGAADPLLDHLVREIAATHNAVLARGPRAEDARALASHLRTLTVHAHQTDLDAQVRAAVRALVAAEGRNNVMFHETDVATRLKTLEQFGFRVHQRLLNHQPTPADYKTRAAALDAVLSGGLTPVWRRMAVTLERLAPELERRGGGQIAAISARQDPAYWQGFCQSLYSDYQEAQVMAAPVCFAAAMPFMSFLSAACAAAEGTAMAFLAMFAVYCVGRV